MPADLQKVIFQDDEGAREWLEARIRANGRYCRHCGAVEARTRKLEGKAHRVGVYECNDCREQFTATVGTFMERSKLPLSKWLMAIYLLSASKRGMGANRLSRMLGISYKSTWFTVHRIREAMREPAFVAGPIGGANKVVEVDETDFGGKAKSRNDGTIPCKEAVVALVERDDRVPGYHVTNVTAANQRAILVTQIARTSYLTTDESPICPKVGSEVAGHDTVNHSIDEYVRYGGFMHTNTVEGFFSFPKHGSVGVYHHVPPLN